ncbi:MAG TPA: sirohydrochlorin nickelochelatase [Methanocorpusculum sp.]|nr:sirohydrochlorin nickelochelatase [Methanocorpusculum sp.]
MEKIGILLVGHGSRLEYNKQLITVTAEMMHEKRPDTVIRSCFLEYSDPNVTAGLDQMKTEDIDILLVVPLFLAKGIHIMRDIPRLLGLENGAKTGEVVLDNGKTIPFAYADPIGIDALLADLMLKNADAAYQLVSKQNQ